jgi:hypothetical protein
MRRSVLYLTAAVLCAASPAIAGLATTWRAAIHPDDRIRLLALWPAWTTAKAAAVDHGKTADWVALGPLADPAPSAEGMWPAAGAYRCRLVKLGARLPGRPDIAATRDFPCAMTNDGGIIGFTVRGAFQASSGRLYPDGERMVFLGVDAQRRYVAVRLWRRSRPQPGRRARTDRTGTVAAGAAVAAVRIDDRRRRYRPR